LIELFLENVKTANLIRNRRHYENPSKIADGEGIYLVIELLYLVLIIKPKSFINPIRS